MPVHICYRGMAYLVLGRLGRRLQIDRVAARRAQHRPPAGIAGLETEAWFGEATMTPVESEDDRAALIRCLQASIDIARRSEARPLLLKAETLLSGTMSGA
jgi:hypothetical protein